MEDELTIELRPGAASVAVAYGFLAFIAGGLALAGAVQIGTSTSPGRTGGALVPLILSALALVAGLSIIRRVTRPRTMILHRGGLTIRDRAGESRTPWAEVKAVVLRRIPKAKGTEPAVLIRRHNSSDLQFRSHYSVAPEELFIRIDGFVRAHDVPVVTEARSLDFSLHNWLPEI